MKDEIVKCPLCSLQEKIQQHHKDNGSYVCEVTPMSEEDFKHSSEITICCPTDPEQDAYEDNRKRHNRESIVPNPFLPKRWKKSSKINS